ncbi:hypothetical protein MAR_036111 [Mya arenaria]|uniref:Uncharacterized protein n=1 Tax=Mya arenaria TaxID=6604 RepID=A0ABY7EP72_MYAAR|nr:hypothetical protein MAR_036111 [Mya arenaria]
MDKVIQEMLYLIPAADALYSTILHLCSGWKSSNGIHAKIQHGCGIQKLFLKLGLRMFGGRFINFMCGYKIQQEEKDVHSETLGKRYDPVPQRLFALQLAITEYEIFLCYIDNCKEREKLESLSQEFRQKLQEILLKSLRDNPAGILQANALIKKKDHTKEKLTWKKSKFAYAISVKMELSMKKMQLQQ